MQETFQPPVWISSRHLQSILPSLQVRRPWVERRLHDILTASREVLLDCGEGVTLQGLLAAQAARPAAAGSGREPRVAVLLHGWEGSAGSLYMLSLAQQLYARGFDVVRLNLRDHGETHHLNRELFHSCRLPEVIGAVRAIQQRYEGVPLHLAGFSLGGNFMLRVAARAAEERLAIAKVVAVSPVLEPSATLDALEHGFFAYHWYFVRKWTRSLARKQAAWPADYDFASLGTRPSLRAMTAELVRRFTSFPSLEDYLRGYALTDGRLAGLEVPATMIVSLDDPIIPAHDLARIARPQHLKLITTRRGGHCGFMERLSGSTWAERRVIAELDSAEALANA